MQLSKEKIEMDKWDLEWRRSTGWMCLLKWENAGRDCWSPVEDPPLWKTTQGCIEIKPSWEMGPKSIWRRLVVELKKMVFAERKGPRWWDTGRVIVLGVNHLLPQSSEWLSRLTESELKNCWSAGASGGTLTLTLNTKHLLRSKSQVLKLIYWFDLGFIALVLLVLRRTNSAWRGLA